jgi:sugar lactone lactonase YvrE
MRKKSNYRNTVLLALIFCMFSFSSWPLGAEVQHRRILVRGADHYGTVTVRFSPAGEMFVSDAFANKLLKMDPQTGKVLDTITEGVEGIADLDFGPDGTMYWVNPFAAQIYKKTPDGITSLVVQMTGVLDGVAVNAEGRLFTATFDGRNLLYELDPNGIEAPKVVANAGGLDAYDFGPDGFLYAPDFLFGSGNVFKIDVDTGIVEVISDGFGGPISTRFSPAGELYVLDTQRSELVKVDINTGAKTLIARVTPNADNFDFGPDGVIYIANNADSYIAKILPNGKTFNLTKPGLSSPGGIVALRDAAGKEVLYVGDAFVLRRYDAASGVLQESFYTDLGNPFAAVPPTALSADGNNLISINSLFNFLQVWDPIAGVSLEMYNDFAMPINAVRFQGELMVAQLITGDVVRAGNRTAIISGLSVPAGMASDNKNLWVGDWATGTIWKVGENGAILPQPKQLISNLQNPEGITIDADGSLLVIETGTQRLIRIDPETGNSSVIVENLEVGLAAPAGTPPTWVALSSVAVSDSGALYITADKGNCIYKVWWTGK